ncbi:MAG TPA: MFS transporter, partial [Acidimicrobiales bacterium]|nr:MFS transporter [Acidimicrobiales bacterium]
PLIFLVNVPAGIVGMVLGWFLIPRSRHLAERTPFDWVGLAIFVPPVTALLLAISYGNRLGWSSPLIIGLFGVVVVMGAAFLRWERRAAAPMLDLSLFRRVPFSAGIASGLLSYLVLFGVLFVVPYLLENALHVSVGLAGLELMVMPVGLGLAAPVAGRLADRVGARPLTVGGMVLTAAMLVVLVVSHGNEAAFLVELGLLGVGLGAFTPPNNAAIMGAAPRWQSGVASGVLNMTRSMGTSLGLALTGLVFELFAGLHPTQAGPVSMGFNAAALFLAAVSVLAAALAALRGSTGLAEDPTLTAE